jgi:hypothetical protein
MFTVEGVYTREAIQKYSYFKRRLQELEYGDLAAARIKTFRPDFLISANTPLDAQKIMMRTCRQT